MAAPPGPPVAARLAVLRSLSSRFGSEAGLVMLARIMQNGNGFLLSVLIVRRFGVAAAGTMAIATVATVVVGLLGSFGLPYVLARSKSSIAVLNAIGLLAALAIVPLTLPFAGLLGFIWGRDHNEALVIAALALGGPFFAQVNILSALQVLQGRAAQSVIPPAANLLGLIGGALIGSTYLEFAILLALFRFAGTLLAFVLLPMSRCNWRLVLRHLRDGARYLTADALNLGSDQVTVLISSWLMTRGELGLFGLSRQMLTVADTPGWSLMQAAYPRVVNDAARNMPGLRRSMVLLGVACAAAIAILIFPMAFWLFRQPRLVPLVCLLMASLPLRYLLSSYDQYLRATGCIRQSNLVSLLRSAAGLVIIPAAVWADGALGGVVGIITQTVLGLGITRRASAALRWEEARAPLGSRQVVG